MTEVLWNGEPIGELVEIAKEETRSIPPKTIGWHLRVRLADGVVAPLGERERGTVTLSDVALWDGARDDGSLFIAVPFGGGPFGDGHG